MEDMLPIFVSWVSVDANIGALEILHHSVIPLSAFAILVRAVPLVSIVQQNHNFAFSELRRPVGRQTSTHSSDSVHVSSLNQLRNAGDTTFVPILSCILAFLNQIGPGQLRLCLHWKSRLCDSSSGRSTRSISVTLDSTRTTSTLRASFRLRHTSRAVSSSKPPL